MKLTTLKSKNTTYQYIQTKQFKTRVLSIRFFSDIDDDNLTSRSLMLSMLKAKNQLYPTRKIQSKHLESLYDTLLSAQSIKFGTKYLNQITFLMIDDAYTIEKQLFRDVVAFLKAMLFSPDFDEKTLEEEKQFLKDYFQAEYTNKNRYAKKQYSKHLLKTYPYNLSPLGKEEDIDHITLDSIRESHRKMLNENKIVVSLMGDIEPNSMHELLCETLPLASIELTQPMIYRHDFATLPNMIESHEVTQTRLFMTYKSEIYYRDEDYLVILVFNALFGEGGDSLLFQTVREQYGLCYYVSSSYAPFTGLITVNSGLDAENVEKAMQLVEESLTLIQKGDFSEEALNLAKASLITGIKHSYDSPASLSIKALRSVLFDVPFEEASLIENIQNISKEDIMNVAKKLTSIFTYQLGGKS